MINYCDYIDSKDVRELLKSIDYQFSPKAAAYVVFMCRHIDRITRHELWRDIMKSCDDPSLAVLQDVIDAGHRNPVINDDTWDGIPEEDKRLLHIPNTFAPALRYPCPFLKNDVLRVIDGEGIFKSQPVIFRGWVYDCEYGMAAVCRFTDGYGKNNRARIPMLNVERW